MSSDPFPRLTISEPCNYDRMILSVQTTTYFFLVPFQIQIVTDRSKLNKQDEVGIELVSKELNHLAAILHVNARGLNFKKKKKTLLCFKEKMEILLHF